MNTQHKESATIKVSTWFGVHLLTVLGMLVGGAVEYGSMTTRLASLETTTAKNQERNEALNTRMIAANEETARSIAALATSLERVSTTVNERTSRVESRAAQNSSAVRRQDARQDELSGQQDLFAAQREEEAAKHKPGMLKRVFGK